MQIYSYQEESGVPSSSTVAAPAVDEIIADLVGLPGALLPILHRVQEHYGYVPASAVPVIAKALHLSRAEVHGVVTFYHDFRSVPPGRRIVKLCRAEACQSMGAERLIVHAEKTLGTALGTTRADGAVTLEPIYCLGNCALSPAATIDGQVHGRLTPERFDTLVGAGTEPS
jgi:formate dehydrogenase subunit gamma